MKVICLALIGLLLVSPALADDQTGNGMFNSTRTLLVFGAIIIAGALAVASLLRREKNLRSNATVEDSKLKARIAYLEDALTQHCDARGISRPHPPSRGKWTDDDQCSWLFKAVTEIQEIPYNFQVIEHAPDRFAVTEHARNTLALRYGIAIGHMDPYATMELVEPVHDIKVKQAEHIPGNNKTFYRVRLKRYGNREAIALIEARTVITFNPLSKDWFDKNEKLELMLKDNVSFNTDEIARFHVSMSNY